MAPRCPLACFVCVVSIDIPPYRTRTSFAASASFRLLTWAK